jgi:Fic family protein
LARTVSHRIPINIRYAMLISNVSIAIYGKMAQFVKPALHRAVVQKWKLLDSMRPLPAAVLANLRGVFRTEFTYNSNAIEGNSLTLRETQLVIEEGQTIRGKSLREIYEARNHPEAIEYVESLANEQRRLAEPDILTLHQIIMKDVMNEKEVGRYRKGEVRIRGSKHVPPPAYDVPTLMEDLLKTVNDNPDDYTTVELAAITLHKFVHIHPFYDGNGRVARLLTNLVLMRKRYLPIIIPQIDRAKYLRCLERADVGDYRPLANFVAQCVIKHLDMALRAVEQKPGDRRLSLKEAAGISSTSPDYLRVLANRGLIPATKEGRNWVVSETDLVEFVRKRGARLTRIQNKRRHKA